MKVEGLASYEQLDRILAQTYPTIGYNQILLSPYHSGTRNKWLGVKSMRTDTREDAAFAARYEDKIREQLMTTILVMKTTWLNTSAETMACPKSYVLPNGASSVETAALRIHHRTEAASPLTEDEEQDLKGVDLGQNSDGRRRIRAERSPTSRRWTSWGFHVREPLGPDDDYFIDSQD